MNTQRLATSLVALNTARDVTWPYPKPSHTQNAINVKTSRDWLHHVNLKKPKLTQTHRVYKNPSEIWMNQIKWYFFRGGSNGSNFVVGTCRFTKDHKNKFLVALHSHQQQTINPDFRSSANQGGGGGGGIKKKIIISVPLARDKSRSSNTLAPEFPPGDPPFNVHLIHLFYVYTSAMWTSSRKGVRHTLIIPSFYE